MNRLFQPLQLILLVVALLRPASAECNIVKRGLSGDLLLIGTVLTNQGALQDSSVFVQSGRITHVGDICGLGARGGDASVLNCTGSVISPGFINTHEHISFSTVSPFPDIGERVSHLFSGTTSIIGGGMVLGLARNLDFPEGLEDGLDNRLVIYDTFPLKDGLGVMRNGDCDYGPSSIDRDTAIGYHRYISHIGEGIDVEAANEFTCLSNVAFDTTPALGGGGLSTDIIGPNLALVQALGLTPRDFDVVAARGAKIVWSPRSNMYLYGQTLNVSYLLEAGITVALGTDWLPSGSATMGREAACAASVANEVFGMKLPPKELWKMATVNAAIVAGFEDQLGSLEVGKLADIVVFEGRSQEDGEHDIGTADPFGQAIFAPQEKIELVLRGGKPLLASSTIRDLTSGTCELIAFGNSNKIVCIADELGSSFKELEASLQGVYPVVLPDLPPDEPTCKPKLYS
ncbi:hypothetical protein E0Z10_g3573 [Xylaria hypoxylon]|uniref:Amidohydrolase-related domain-containing protein n=1 Tax=Xylaria hypoxylon TaxID=37992 RepID=A0A4Z0Z9B3_9PEZI|nr:hypothetical protein E0Z10_g3573 [Xylaria hypoxylon]